MRDVSAERMGLKRRKLTLGMSCLSADMMLFSQAKAQGSRRSGATELPPHDAVRSVPAPCTSRPNDIFSVLLEATALSHDGMVATIGQAFRHGDLPQGAQLRARLEGGREISCQFDVSVRNADGSARFGVVSLALPALTRGQSLGVILSREAAAPQVTPIDMTASLAMRRAIITISPEGGGTPWEVDLIDQLRGRPHERQHWKSGPLASQRRITAAVPAAAIGGVTSMRLVADFEVHADGALWIDLWLRNDAAMRPGGGTARYTLRLTVDGREVLRRAVAQHFQYQGWGRLVGIGPGGVAPSQPFLRPNAAYLADTGAIARYDLSAGVTEEQLVRMQRTMDGAEWAATLGPRGITQYMETAGGRGDIGPTTMWQAAWLISGDRRAALYSMGQAEAAGAVPWHIWDPRGGWMDNRRWPNFWHDPRNGPPPRSLIQPIPADTQTGWYLAASHQPDLSYVPYLLTGRRAFLDELQAQSAWNVLAVYPEQRRAPGVAQGINMIHSRQVRSMAWSMRQLSEAAWISPDSDPQQDYFRDVANRNWSWARSQIPTWTAAQGEAHGWIPPEDFGVEGALAPWQQDYFASSAAAAARYGNDDARALLAWMANFLVGRFQSDAQGLPRNDGAAFTLTICRPGQQTNTFYKSWVEIGNAMRARSQTNGTGWARSEGEYGRVALQSLALLQDVLGHAGARQAYQSLLTNNPPPFTDWASIANQPTNSIVPRTMPRVPHRAPGCASGRE